MRQGRVYLEADANNLLAGLCEEFALFALEEAARGPEANHGRRRREEGHKFVPRWGRGILSARRKCAFRVEWDINIYTEAQRVTGKRTRNDS